jgi:hypothetical protein
MFIVTGINLDKKGIVAGSVMAFYNFRNLPEFLDNIAIMTRMIQKHTNIGTGLESDECRINLELGSLNHTGFYKPLNPLVNGSAGNIAFPGNFKIRDPGIFSNDIQNLLIQIIYLNIFTHHRRFRLTDL